MKFAASAIFLPSCVCLSLCCSEAANGTVPAVFAFGDSILDTGNNQIPAFLKSNTESLPPARVAAGGLTRECSDDINNGAQMYNTKLSSEPSRLNDSPADSKIFYLDIYKPLLALVQHPETSGEIFCTTISCF